MQNTRMCTISPKLYAGCSCPRDFLKWVWANACIGQETMLMALAELAIFPPAWPRDGISKSHLQGFMLYGPGCSFMVKLVCSQYQASKLSGSMQHAIQNVKNDSFFPDAHTCVHASSSRICNCTAKSYLVHGHCYITAMKHTQHCQFVQALCLNSNAESHIGPPAIPTYYRRNTIYTPLPGNSGQIRRPIPHEEHC